VSIQVETPGHSVPDQPFWKGREVIAPYVAAKDRSSLHFFGHGMAWSTIVHVDLFAAQLVLHNANVTTGHSSLSSGCLLIILLLTFRCESIDHFVAHVQV
jgi:hypothetical protein